MSELKTYSWSWIKEEVARALVGIVVLGFVTLIGYGVLQSFIGDSKIEKAVDGLRKEMVDRHNATVAREADLLHKITLLQSSKKIMPPMSAPFTPLNDFEAPNPAQVQLDFQKANNEKYSPPSKN